MSDATPSELKAANTSLGDLLGEVTKDLSTLMRQELELAKAELQVSAKKSAKAGAMLGGAGYAGHITVLFLSITLWMGLAYLIGLGWAALVVAVIWGIVAAILYVVGRKKFQEVEGAPQTVETLKEIPDAFSRNEENR